MMTQSEKLDHCKKKIKRLNSEYSQLESDRETALKFISGDPSIVTLVRGRSELVTYDMWDTIQTTLPDILETIAGIDEPLKLDPTGPEDVEPVKKLEILGNIMVRRKNQWFRECMSFLDDSMRLKFGAFKYQWISDEKDLKRTFKNPTDEELAVLLSTEGAEIEKDEVNEKDGSRTIVVRYPSPVDEFVKIEAIPAERIKFPMDSRDFDNPAFVVEEVRMYRHQFIETYGLKNFKKLENDVASMRRGQYDRVLEQRFADLGGLNFIYDQDNEKFKAYECYFPDEDDPKIKWMFVFAGDNVLIDEENKYGKPPYEGGSPFLMAHRLIGQGYFDVLKDIQKRRTYLERQITDNVTQANFRRYFGDPERMNIDDYLNNNATNALIRVQGDPHTVVMGEEKAPLPPELLQYREMLLVEKDYHVPTPRVATGINPQLLNKTYRGQQQQQNQANKRLLMMIRGYMESVFALLFRDVVDCILRFMKQGVVVRYLNQPYEITPDNIIGKFDLVVNAGLGSHDKNDMIVKLQQLIGLMMQVMATGTGVIQANNIAYVMQEIVKAMGFLNTTDFVADPKLKEVVMQFVQETMMFLQQLTQVPTIAPAVAEIMPGLMQMGQQIMQGFGIQQQQQKGGENTAGTFPGQEPPAIPEQSMNESNPMMTPDGGGYWA